MPTRIFEKAKKNLKQSGPIELLKKCQNEGWCLINQANDTCAVCISLFWHENF
jgi:hypothetical protein